MTNVPKISRQFIEFAAGNAAILAFVTIYTSLRYSFLNPEIPLWYVKPWGTYQLAPKAHIYLIPLVAAAIIVFGSAFLLYAKKVFMRYAEEIIMLSVTSVNLVLAASVLRIIFRASIPFEPLIDPAYLKLAAPFASAFALSYLITPRFIEFAKNRNIVTDPEIHKHPGMILVKPSARGGGVVFSVVFAVLTLVFVHVNKVASAILLAALMAALTGFLDDVANTSPQSKFKIFGSPVFRLLFLQPVAILFVIFAGIRISGIGGTFILNEFLVNAGPVPIAPLSLGITFLWILWVINMLSFSNGVDGQYGGIVGIASIVVSILSLRFVPLKPEQVEVAQMAAIAAGASFGLTPYTWHPSKILWGFGATSAGIILATLSIITGAKVATAIIVLLIPFLDAAITVVRRILQGRPPWHGDKGHLHHLLLERGWSVKKIAVFYWVTTGALGAVALMSSEKHVALVAMTLSGIVAFILVSLNLQSVLRKQARQLLERQAPTQ